MNTPRILLIGSLAALMSCASWAQVNVEAVGNISNGCIFGVSSNGVLGQSQNMQTLSTSEAGGSRPSLSFTVIGNAVLSQVPGLKWRKGSTEHNDVATHTASLMTAPTGGTAVNLPATFSTAGSYTLYLEMAGSHATRFMQAGKHTASATFNCV